MTVEEFRREENISSSSQTVSRSFYVSPASDRAAFIASVLGGPRIIGGIIRRVRPMSDSVYPHLFALSARNEFVDFPTGGQKDSPTVAVRTSIVANRAAVTIEFGIPEFEEGEGDQPEEIEYATVNKDFTGRSLTLPTEYWVIPGLNEASSPNSIQREGLQLTKVMPGVGVVVVRHYCIKEPENAIINLTGRVNKRPFKLGNKIYAAEMIRFEGGSTMKKYTNFGNPFREITYRFAIQPVYDRIGWDLLGSGANANVRPNITEFFTESGTKLTLQEKELKRYIEGDANANPPVPKGELPFAYVGWNRVFIPRLGAWVRPALNREKRPHEMPAPSPSDPPVTEVEYMYDPKITPYQLDDDAPSQTIQSQTVRGFDLLFNPGAN